MYSIWKYIYPEDGVTKHVALFDGTSPSQPLDWREIDPNDQHRWIPVSDKTYDTVCFDIMNGLWPNRYQEYIVNE